MNEVNRAEDFRFMAKDLSTSLIQHKIPDFQNAMYSLKLDYQQKWPEFFGLGAWSSELASDFSGPINYQTPFPVVKRDAALEQSQQASLAEAMKKLS